MRHYFGLSTVCAVLIFAISVSVSVADAQEMPRRKDCRKGMTFQQCHDQCLKLGGKPHKGGKQLKGCADRCSKMGCQ